MVHTSGSLDLKGQIVENKNLHRIGGFSNCFAVEQNISTKSGFS